MKKVFILFFKVLPPEFVPFDIKTKHKKLDNEMLIFRGSSMGMKIL